MVDQPATTLENGSAASPVQERWYAREAIGSP
jgi:hypothetical protein